MAELLSLLKLSIENGFRGYLGFAEKVFHLRCELAPAGQLIGSNRLSLAPESPSGATQVVEESRPAWGGELLLRYYYPRAARLGLARNAGLLDRCAEWGDLP